MYNDDGNKIIEEATQDKSVGKLNFLINLTIATTDIMPVPEETTSFAIAWSNSNSKSHAKVQEAICKEFADINKQQVWCKTCKTLIPPN